MNWKRKTAAALQLRENINYSYKQKNIYVKIVYCIIFGTVAQLHEILTK